MKPASVRFFRRSVLPHLTGLTLPLLVVGLALAAGAWTCGPTEPEPEFTTYTFEGEGEWAGVFEYVHNETEDSWACRWISADEKTYGFECGYLMVGLKDGVEPRDLVGLWNEIQGDVVRYWDIEYSFVKMAVPIRTEPDALLVAEDDPQTRYASLNMMGGGPID